MLFPKTYLPSAVDARVDWLIEKGFKGILFDLDNTIIKRDSEQFSQEVLRYIEELRQAGFALAIISNSPTRRVKKKAAELGIPAVCRAAKPLAKPFRRALQLLGTSAAETAFIGDQIFTDVLGGNRAGLHTILVTPMAGKDFIGSRMFNRQLEKLVLARLKKDDRLIYGRLD